jgi:CPA1 family monovalent cation:H+ antiporter
MTESVQKFIDEEFPFKLDEDVLVQIRKPYEANFDLLSKELWDDRPKTQQDSEHVAFISQTLSARFELIKYRRELLIRFHKEGTYNDESISKAERELDIEELRLNAMIQKGEDSNIEFRQSER